MASSIRSKLEMDFNLSASSPEKSKMGVYSRAFSLFVSDSAWLLACVLLERQRLVDVVGCVFVVALRKLKLDRNEMSLGLAGD